MKYEADPSSRKSIRDAKGALRVLRDDNEKGESRSVATRDSGSRPGRHKAEPSPPSATLFSLAAEQPVAAGFGMTTKS